MDRAARRHSDELLDPEKAFRIAARALDRRAVEVEFRIAPGYYMYRDRFSFATEAAADAVKGEIGLRVTSQGCSDLGVCYVPLEQTVRVRLP